MKYIVYKTTCSVNGKIYIGVHQTQDPQIFDGYLGRGFYKNHSRYIKYPESPLHYAIIKYGADKFKRETLFIYDSEKEAYEKEAELVTQEFINREDNYNVTLGGKLNHKLARKVYQFDFEGNKIAEYENVLAASKVLNISPSNINDAILHKRTSVNSLWSDNSSINILEYKINQTNNYFLYDQDGIFITQFNSASECVNFLETNTGNLSRSIKTQGRIKGYFITTQRLYKLQVVVTKLSGKLNRYSLNGQYIDSFNSVKEAKEKLGLKLSSLSTAIKLNRQCNGYRWTRGDNPPMNINI